MELKIGGIYSMKISNDYYKWIEYIVIIELKQNIDKIIGISTYLNKSTIQNNKLFQEKIWDLVKVKHDLSNFWIMSYYSIVKDTINKRISGYLGQVDDELLNFLQNCSNSVFH